MKRKVVGHPTTTPCHDQQRHAQQLHNQQHHNNRCDKKIDKHGLARLKIKFYPATGCSGRRGKQLLGSWEDAGWTRTISEPFSFSPAYHNCRLAGFSLWRCVGESVSVVRGRGPCVHRLHGGGTTLWQKIGSQRGGEGPRWRYLFCTYFKSVVINVAFFVVYICTTTWNTF